MQIKKSVDRIQAPDVVKKLVIDCQMGNESKFEIGLDKSTNIQIKRGLMQGAPLSPLLYNVATNHLIEEPTEQGLVSNYGVNVTDTLKMSALAFADDICVLSNSISSAEALFNIIESRLGELGMSLNVNKTQVIVIKKGVLCSDPISLGGVILHPASEERLVKYLGTFLREQVILDKQSTIQSLSAKIDKVAKSPYLKPDQKLQVLNTYIWPTLTFKLQNTPLDRWSIPFIDDLDKLLRSACRQILEIPRDIPDACFYSSKHVRGFQMFRFS
ncbi:hypothetical protein M8J77_015183 [Diaphorina citri]|nr:hypothetical protein M8J77_015183 [Diaphorina citri]